MSIVKDKVFISYPTLEELFEREEVIKDRVNEHIKNNPTIDTMRTNIKVDEDRFILEVELIKD